MLRIRNSQSGITLVALITTIILMLILSTIIVYNGIDSYSKSQIMKFITEMQVIQGRVDTLAKSGTYAGIGESVSTKPKGTQALNAAVANNDLANTDEINLEDYRYLSTDDIATFLEIDNATSDIVVNFKTREVISVDGVDYNGTQHYTQYNLPGGQSLIVEEEIADREIEEVEITSEINGLNASLEISNISIINGSLMYKLESSDSWTTISNYTKVGQTYEINVSVSGEYIFRLVDNTDNTNNQDTEFDILLTNAPKLEEGMTLTTNSYDYTNYATDASTFAKATKNNKNFVWIPRYAYKGIDIKFIRGNSKIATDGSYIDNTWTIPDKFTPNDTGIWVEITQQNQGSLSQLITNNQ